MSSTRINGILSSPNRQSQQNMVPKLQSILTTWQSESSSSTYDPKPTLLSIAELVEAAYEDFLMQDPDPLDERHPAKTHPLSAMGHVLKTLFRYDDFINKLVVSYLMARDNVELNTIAARLLLDISCGLDAEETFWEQDDLLPQLYAWACSPDTDRCLRAYSFGLITFALDISDVASRFKAENFRLIPDALSRLSALYVSEQMREEELSKEESISTDDAIYMRIDQQGPSTSKAVLTEENGKKPVSTTELSEDDGPFKDMPSESFHSGSRPSLAEVLGEKRKHDRISKQTEKKDSDFNSSRNSEIDESFHREHVSCLRTVTPLKVKIGSDNDVLNHGEDSCNKGQSSLGSPPAKKLRTGKEPSSLTQSNSFLALADNRSNSQWTLLQKNYVGEHRVYPLTLVMEQRLILRYLAYTGEYQDLLKLAYEHRAIAFIKKVLKNANSLDPGLLCDTLRYLCSLLVHRKVGLDFVASGGVELLISVRRTSLPSVVVGMCLYYLAYNGDAMESVCLLPGEVLTHVVDYVLWLLEHSYESGRAAASKFFIHSFHFRPIIERFDENDGLRRLLNYISTLTFLQEELDEIFTDEHLYTSLQAVSHTCIAFRSYMAAHVYMKVDYLRKHYLPRLQAIPNVNIPACFPHGTQINRPMKLDDEALADCVWLLLHTISMSSTWKPVEDMRRLGIIEKLLFIIGEAGNWTNTNIRNDIVKSSLEVIWMCSTVPRVQLDLCECFVKSHRNINCEAVGLLLETCEGEVMQEPELQTAALQVIINFVCGPTERIAGGRLVTTTKDYTSGSTSNISVSSSDRVVTNKVAVSSSSTKMKKPKKTHLDASDVLERMWEAVRRNNGIMILKNLLKISSPITSADALRAIACRALNGLARSESIRQILSKMPLIANNELHGLLLEPILQEKRIEHNRFCEQAKMLIEKVTQKPVYDFPKDSTQEKLWKQFIVNQTKIVFNEKELLQLIHHHLIKNGLTKTAAELRSEADLPDVPASRVARNLVINQPLPKYLPHSFDESCCNRSLRLDSNSRSVYNIPNIVSSSCSESFDNSGISSSMESVFKGSLSSPRTSQESLTSSASRKQLKNPQRLSIGSSGTGYDSNISAGRVPSKRLHLRTSIVGNPLGHYREHTSKFALTPYKNLDEIIVEYFREQHASCQNPVTTCPPFSLFYPHHCPDPGRRRLVPRNLTVRLFNRPLLPLNRKHESFVLDNRFAFSRLRPSRNFTENQETFTCCSFSVDDEHILLGTYAGGLHWFNIYTGVEESNTECHHTALTSIEQSKDGSLLLTSSCFVKPLSSLWRIRETQEHMLNFRDESYVEFSKRLQDKIVGTVRERATVYDVETGRGIVTLFDECLANHYSRNRATFDTTDDLVLNDGILWDIRSASKPVHKFDKLNSSVSGVFHPHGSEVIINTEVVSFLFVFIC
uniref:LisH domain-containing protein n=1 Tax=Syphacia muris TaxID=451379 RepID=A0A158R6C1_9BILA